MPIRDDLGFTYLVVVLILILFFIVLVFQIRLRWRKSLSRQDEVRRLLAKVSAEEEATLAVFHGYLYVPFPVETDYSRPVKLDFREVEIDTRAIESDLRPVLYKCALCLSPATTRCSRCKVARYCSGKCQILHWREGHKIECRPFTAPPQFNDVATAASQKLSLQQEGSEINRNSFESEQCKSGESSGKFELNSSHVDFCGNGGENEHECRPDVAGRDTSSNKTSHDGKLNSRNSNYDQIASSDKLNPIKHSRINHDPQNGLKGASTSNVDGSTEISISDPYIPFSGFWDGTINSGLVNSSDKIGQPSSPFKFHGKRSPPYGVQDSDDKAVRSCNTSDLAGSMSKETLGKDKFTSSTHPPKHGNMKPTSPQKENKVVVDQTISKKETILSSASVVNLQSNNVSHSPLFAKTEKDDTVHASDAIPLPSSITNSKNGFKTSMRKVVDQLRTSKSSRLSGVGSEIADRHIEKSLFPYELFVKLYHWKKVEQLQPFGFLNCGNSCYANAVLQCLVCTPPLASYLLQGFHSKACKWNEWCFTCEFQSLMLRAKEGISPLSPTAILSHIHATKSHFGNGKEEDAHEFLRYVIDTMQSASLREVGVCAFGSLEEETTLIGLTFGGYLRSKIKCMKCGSKSEQHERLMDLTVEIEGDIGSLEESLRKFTSTEILDGENKYQCSRCRSYERAKKKFRVLEAPNVLIITLKRFQSGEFGKLNKWISFPEILDLAPFMSGTSDKSPIYRLYGVIVHLDSMNATYSGHYVCYVKNAENRWFEIDDTRVKPVDLESVLAKRAYMLLYARCSPRAPKMVKNLITRDFKKSKGPPVKLRSHSIGSWNVHSADPLHDHNNGIESFHPNDTSFHLVRTVFEEDLQSENASSIFSEECSCSTESSNRDYSSTDDHFGSNFFNYGNDQWRNSSDSESPSSSSSSGASLSPIYPTSKSSVRVLDSDSNKHPKKIGGGRSSSSCRETHSRLGWANPFGNKKSGLLFRRSVRERTG